MATLVQPAYPYVNVFIDTSALVPVAQRAPGVVAVVGVADDGAAVGPNIPTVVTDHDSVLASFAKAGAANTLTQSLDLVFQQDPQPSKVYGIRTNATKDYAPALASLDAVDDVTFVCLANESAVGNATSGNTAATGLMALKEHVENASAAGNARMAVAMIDPTTPRSPGYVTTVLAQNSYGKLTSDDGRMVLIAARGATLDPTNTAAPPADAAAAAMAAIAGYPPAAGIVLKQVRGFMMPITSQYTPAEITGLSGAGAVPLIDPALIPGSGLYFADGGTLSSDPALGYVDTRRLLDDLTFRLRAGLIGAIGDNRITKAGLTALRVRIEGILGPLQQAGAIDDYSVVIPLLAILSIPDGAREPADEAQVVTARSTRQVSVQANVTLGPDIFSLNVTLAPSY